MPNLLESNTLSVDGRSVGETVILLTEIDLSNNCSLHLHLDLVGRDFDNNITYQLDTEVLMQKNEIGEVTHNIPSNNLNKLPIAAAGAPYVSVSNDSLYVHTDSSMNIVIWNGKLIIQSVY